MTNDFATTSDPFFLCFRLALLTKATQAAPSLYQGFRFGRSAKKEMLAINPQHRQKIDASNTELEVAGLLLVSLLLYLSWLEPLEDLNAEIYFPSVFSSCFFSTWKAFLFTRRFLFWMK